MNRINPAENAYVYPLLIKQLLHTPLACSPRQEIVSGLERRYDYVEFYQRIQRLADGLTSIGVGMGTTVAVMDWDNHRYLECFFGVPMIGAVLHTINVRLAPEQILYTINHADDDFILVHTDFVPLLEAIAGGIERPVKIILLNDGHGGGDETPESSLEFAAEYESMLEGASATFEFKDFDEGTKATTFYTTGTTGDPKGVCYSHRQLVVHTMGLLAGLGTASGNNRFHKGDVYMPITPMFHVHGWGMPYAATMLGVKQVYPGRYEPARLLKLIETEKVTFSHCVPTIMQMLLTAPESADTDLSSLKVVIGGSAMPLGLAQAASERGIEMFTAYGLSETCPFLTTVDLTDPGGEEGSEGNLHRRCQTGKPVPLIDMRLVDPDMNDVPRDGKTTGEVVVRAPWLTQEYVKNSEASEDLWRGGYMHTGDVGYIDETGTLTITDRIKDVIKSGGEWISSLELESIVSACDGVTEVAAIAIPDERWGERPLLVVARAKGVDPPIDGEDVRDAVRASVEAGDLPKWAIPERVEFVDQIDKTSVGKLDKKVLRARYSG